MQKVNLILPFTLFLMTTFACRKNNPNPTTIDLTVLNYETNEPVEGVEVNTGLFLGVSGRPEYVDGQTDANGKLLIDVTNGAKAIDFRFKKPGFAAKYTDFINILSDENNPVKMLMVHYNCTFQLEVTNTKPVTDSLRFKLSSGKIVACNGPSADQFPEGWPIIMQPMTQKTFYIPTIGDDAISVYWTWDYIDVTRTPPFKKVFISPVGDTIVYSVSN